MILFLSMVIPPDPSTTQDKKLKIDETLFARIAADDMAAFEELYRATERSVFAFALSILKNHDDALDVAQDTYLKIRAAAHLYQPMGKPLAWVFTITRNLAITKIRTRKRDDGLPVTDLENDLSFSYVTDSGDKLVLQTAFKILNDQEREIIILHAVSGFTHREIAESLDVPLSTVLSKYHRGLKKLKKFLNEQEVI